jgi:hypothetical protein
MEAYSDLLTPRDLRNSRNFHLWFCLALATFAAGTLLIDGKLVPATIGWGLVILTAALSLGMLRAYVFFLREADELLRKIHIDGLALGFGAGAIFMLVYRLCERLGAPKLDVNDPLLIMVMFWALGQWMGLRRYASPAEERP